jgi:hypothetical protein
VSLWCHLNGRRLTGQCTNTLTQQFTSHLSIIVRDDDILPEGRTSPSVQVPHRRCGAWLRHRIHISCCGYFCMLPSILPLCVRIHDI